jgi:hypothetical protein
VFVPIWISCTRFIADRSIRRYKQMQSKNSILNYGSC